jgi:hypothetical protein
MCNNYNVLIWLCTGSVTSVMCTELSWLDGHPYMGCYDGVADHNFVGVACEPAKDTRHNRVAPENRCAGHNVNVGVGVPARRSHRTSAFWTE